SHGATETITCTKDDTVGRCCEGQISSQSARRRSSQRDTRIKGVGPMSKHSGFRPAPRDWRSLPPAFVLIVLCSTPAHAQVAGTISGYVHDQAGGVMPGTIVTAESAGRQLVRSTESNATGFFDLQALPRGTYVVKVEIAGFETQVRKNVEVTAGGNVRLDFTLRV